jgi:hypothetical protein
VPRQLLTRSGHGLEIALLMNRVIEPGVRGTRLKQMQHLSDALWPALSVFMAACTASYLWIFLYRPVAAHRFSIPQLKALVWHKRLPGHVYFVFAMLGLGIMFVKGIEASLWWAPKTWTVWMDGEERSVISVAAIGVGMLSAQIVMVKSKKSRKRFRQRETGPSCYLATIGT